MLTSIFFSAPGWVDTSKPAGRTPQLPWVLRTAESYWKELLTLRKFCGSPPHLVLLMFAMLMHVVDRYDFEAARQGMVFPWLAHRALVNFVVAGCFYSFFLVIAPMICGRKFNPNTSPIVQQLCHDIWYWSLGILQWTFWECLFVRAWATGRLGYIADDELMSMSGGFPKWLLASGTTVLWLVFHQAFRAPHFYFCHRLIHFRPLYRAFHALHHRNVDVETFSGLAMHPAEHLYYFSSFFFPAALVFLVPSSVAPLCTVSPLVMRFAAFLAVLVPGATHSGYEDHTLSQQEHYIHHTTFNKNFGAGAGCYLDHLFGTFTDRVVTGEVEDDGSTAKKDSAGSPKARTASSRATLLGRPQAYDLMFATACLAVAVYLCRGAMGGDVLDSANRLPISERHLRAAVAAFGPLIAAMALWAWRDSASWQWPFQREPYSSSLFHVMIGSALSVLPVYSTLLAVL